MLYEDREKVYLMVIVLGYLSAGWELGWVKGGHSPPLAARWDKSLKKKTHKCVRKPLSSTAASGLKNTLLKWLIQTQCKYATTLISRRETDWTGLNI